MRENITKHLAQYLAHSKQSVSVIIANKTQGESPFKGILCCLKVANHRIKVCCLSPNKNHIIYFKNLIIQKGVSLLL